MVITGSYRVYIHASPLVLLYRTLYTTGILMKIFTFSIFSSSLLAKHKDSLTELIRRDKNRPSVIMWSVANEPRTQNPAADEYFK